jgi:hypothetical protein
MNSKNRGAVADLEADPFGESASLPTSRDFRLMGGRFRFDSNSAALLHLVDAAYKGLPPQQFSKSPPEFRISLRLAPAPGKIQSSSEHFAPLSMLHGSELFGAATHGSTFSVLSPNERRALLVVSAEALKSEYHVRYELIEFTVFTLASRAQQLVPLHAACVGLNGRGVLLMGASGAGKSTLALQSLVEKFEFLAEDSVFVSPDTLQATGTANFLHVRADSLRWLDNSRLRAIFEKSPTISAEQAYGAGLPQWKAFERNIGRLGGVELRRGTHPSDGVAALRALLRRG